MRHSPASFDPPASAWSAAEPLPDTRPLEGDRRADVVVVGAGYTGLSAACTWPNAAPTWWCWTRRSPAGRLGTQRRAGHPRPQGRPRRAGAAVRSRHGPADVADHGRGGRLSSSSSSPATRSRARRISPAGSARRRTRQRWRPCARERSSGSGAVRPWGCWTTARRRADRYDLLRGRHARPARRRAPAAGHVRGLARAAKTAGAAIHGRSAARRSKRRREHGG